MSYAYASLGWATTQSASSPTTTPPSLQNLVIISVPMSAKQTVAPYQYLDGTTRGFSQGTVYETKLALSPLPFTFDATGENASTQIDVWMQNDPKFIQCTDATWVSRMGSGWVRVTSTGYELEAMYGINRYTLQVRTASPVYLS